MRVLVMANNFPWPGNADGIFNLRQVQALRERGHDVRVIRWAPWAPPASTRWRAYRSIPAQYVFEGISVRALRVFLGPRHLGLATLPSQFRSRIAAIVREFRPDVGHVHGLLPAGMMGVACGIPFVLTAHGSETYRLPRRLEGAARRVVRRAAACAGVSDFVASHLRRLGASETTVVFNGANASLFRPQDRHAARRRLGLPEDRPTVVFAGHVDPPKGVRELQQAALRLADLKPQFVFAGGGSLQDELARVLPAGGIDVKFFPWLDHTALADVIAAADVFTLPSHAEGLPTALCETMCSGRAIVATRVGGIPEIVADGVTGFLIDVGDVDALAGRLRTVLTDPPLRESFETAALAFARQHLTWNANAATYEQLYERISR